MKKLKAALEQVAVQEKGQALVLVLILVMIAGLATAPLLNFMSTGIKTDTVYASRTNSLYAADTGVKDAIWQMDNGHYIPTQGGGATSPPSITANGVTENVAISWFDNTPTYKIVATTSKTTVTCYAVINIGSPIFNQAINATGNITYNAGNATITGDVFSQTGQVIFPSSGSNHLYGNVYAPLGIPSGGKGTITGTVEVNTGNTVSSGVSTGGVTTGTGSFTPPTAKMTTLSNKVQSDTSMAPTGAYITGPVTLSNLGSSSNPFVYPTGSGNQSEYYVSGDLSFSNGNYITFNEPVYISGNMDIQGNPHIVFNYGVYVAGNLTIESNSLQEFSSTLCVGGNFISNGRVQADNAVYIGGALTLTNGAYIYDSIATATADNKVIVVDGAISMSGGTSLGSTNQIPLIINLSTSPVNFTLTNGSNVEAYIYAPHADVTMDGNASLTGSVIANSFTLGSGSGSPSVTYYPPPANRPDLQQFTSSGSSSGGTTILSYIVGVSSGGGSGGGSATVTVTSSANPSSSGQSVNFTATVSGSSGTPTGKVTFYDGSTALGNSTLSSGKATYATSALSIGSHSITGVYGGDSKYAGSTSPALNQTVNGLSTFTSLSSSQNPSTYNQSVTFTATVSPGTATGTVTFYDGVTQLGSGTLNGSGQATCSTTSLSIGSHSITVVYGGDTTYTGSTSSALNQTVNGATSSTSVTSSLNPSTSGQSVTFTATVTGSGSTPTGTVTFKDGSNTLGATSLNGSGMATYATTSLTTGSHSVTAVYNGDSNYAGSTSTVLTQTVNAASSSTSVSSSLNPSASGQSVTFTATVTPSAATGTVQFKIDGTNFGSAVNLTSGSATSGATTTLTTGTHTVTAVYSGDSNYSTSTGTLAGGQTVGATINVTTSKNWSAITTGTGTGGQPSSADTVNITGGGTLTVDVSNATAGTVSVGDASNDSNTLTFNASKTLTVTNISVFGNNSGHQGTIKMTNGGTLNITGSMTIGSNGVFTYGTGTVNYSGSGNQNVQATTYYNLIFSGSGAKSMVTGTSVTKNLSIAPTGNATASVGAGLSLSINTLTLGGTLQTGPSTWGGTGSGATHIVPTYFAATTGKLAVAH